jgi:hypothetical protein
MKVARLGQQLRQLRHVGRDPSRSGKKNCFSVCYLAVYRFTSRDTAMITI